MFFAVTLHLEQKFGLSISSIKGFSRALYSTIRAPKTLHEKDLLFIDVDIGECWFIENELPSKQGIVFDTSRSKELVCRYLGVEPKQASLQLGLLLVG